MGVYVDKELCIACGYCVSTAPEVFSIGDDGRACAAADIPPVDYGAVEDAIECCPVSAIGYKSE